jgi:hypothetical protein
VSAIARRATAEAIQDQEGSLDCFVAYASRNDGEGGSLRRQSMIRKNGNRFSEKIMLKQRDEIMMRFCVIAS